MGPSQGYLQGNSSNSQANPSVPSQSPWALPSQGYSFAAQPGFPQPQPVQQAAFPNYGQGSLYPNPSYGGAYQGQYSHTRSAFNNQFQALQSQVPVSQQPYLGGSSSYFTPYATNNQSQTISPQVLQRSEHNVPQAQVSFVLSESRVRIALTRVATRTFQAIKVSMAVQVIPVWGMVSNMAAQRMPGSCHHQVMLPVPGRDQLTYQEAKSQAMQRSKH
jgi:hypothetical protein